MTPTPDDKWVAILSTQGLAVVIALFGMFVVFPIGVVAVRAVAKWFGAKIDEYLSVQSRYIDASITAIQQNAETQEDLKNMMDRLAESSETHHAESQLSLTQIRQSVDTLHQAVDHAGASASKAATAAADKIVSAKAADASREGSQ